MADAVPTPSGAHLRRCADALTLIAALVDALPAASAPGAAPAAVGRDAAAAPPHSTWSAHAALEAAAQGTVDPFRLVAALKAVRAQPHAS
jgi:hypothetical protein